MVSGCHGSGVWSLGFRALAFEFRVWGFEGLEVKNRVHRKT